MRGGRLSLSCARASAGPPFCGAALPQGPGQGEGGHTEARPSSPRIPGGLGGQGRKVWGGGPGSPQRAPLCRAAAHAALSGLRASRWIDRSTRAVSVHFTLYNPPTRLLSSVSLRAELLPAGGLALSPLVESVAIFHSNSSQWYRLTLPEVGPPAPVPACGSRAPLGAAHLPGSPPRPCSPRSRRPAVPPPVTQGPAGDGRHPLSALRCTLASVLHRGVEERPKRGLFSLKVLPGRVHGGSARLICPGTCLVRTLLHVLSLLLLRMNKHRQAGTSRNCSSGASKALPGPGADNNTHLTNCGKSFSGAV